MDKKVWEFLSMIVSIERLNIPQEQKEDLKERLVKKMIGSGQGVRSE